MTERVSPMVPFDNTNDPALVMTLSTREILPTPSFVSVKPFRNNPPENEPPPTGPRISQRPGEPALTLALPASDTKRIPLFWSAPELTMAPAPPTPAPEIVTCSPGLNREVPARSRVAPLATVVPLFVVPSAAVLPAWRVPEE